MVDGVEGCLSMKRCPSRLHQAACPWLAGWMGEGGNPEGGWERGQPSCRVNAGVLGIGQLVVLGRHGGGTSSQGERAESLAHREH